MDRGVRDHSKRRRVAGSQHQEGGREKERRRQKESCRCSGLQGRKVSSFCFPVPGFSFQSFDLVFNDSIMEDASFAKGDCFSMNEVYVHDVVGSSKTLPVVGMAVDDGFCVDSPTEGLVGNEEDDEDFILH
ncbi:hypothetical protein L6452_20074 [Arctium lappa]|uniref:Uncharacterized protein n=1 Tax=Arctium lappa TaxID=4217 RepID=A0ACB9BAE5_ARCLA|nr:hypothetical protein L6452_20074 [Arctium lappa]